MALGSLREQLLYPTSSENLQIALENIQSSDSLHFLMDVSEVEDDSRRCRKPTTDDLVRVLETVRLSDIVSRFNGLDTVCEWSSVLSLGEQQCLAFTRMLLSRPTLVILDESTSALDESHEAHLYKQIEGAGITYVSIGHRRTLYKYHNKILRITELSEYPTKPNWHLEPIEATAYEPSKPA